MSGLARWLRAAMPAGDYSFAYENVLGTSLDVRLWATSRRAACRAERRILERIDMLEAVFSSYDPNSELRRWQRAVGEPVPLSPELFEVLRMAEAWRERSGGAFHPAAEGFARLWREAERHNRAPDDSERAALCARMSEPIWRLDPETRTGVCLTSLPLTLNAVAKGYIVDRACAAAMETMGIRAAVLNIGGDLRVHSERGEVVGITGAGVDAENAPPVARVTIRDGAVATSGGGRRGFEICGRRLSHVIDPRTGDTAEGIRSASVIAPTAADADAMATACSVLAPPESLALADELPGIECFLIDRNGRQFRSAGWNAYEIPSSRKQDT